MNKPIGIYSRLKQSFATRFERLRNVSSAYRKSVFSEAPLPPGNLSRFDLAAPKDQRFLLKQFEKYGVIFKTVWHEKLLVCVVGLETSQKLLSENSDKIKSINVELRHIFPEGFIRNMRGETHRKYRSHFTGALKFEIDETNEAQLAAIISKVLSELSETGESSPNAESYRAALNEITTGLLLLTFFGVEFQSDEFLSLSEKYARLGPDGLVWKVGDTQREIYLEIVDDIQKLVEPTADDTQGLTSNSVLSRMLKVNAIDETVIGNLIYMVETGRFDMYSLFHWLTKFLVDNPEISQAISGDGDHGLAKAFVLETLRMEQSEGLIREATEDFVFAGYLIPKGTAIRLCLWEPHKFEDPFSDPFKFDPRRFLNNNYTIEQYAPFGLDQHRCPAGDMVVAMSSLFIKTLTKEFEIECVADGPPFRGIYHWQPSENFSVRIQKKAKIAGQ